MVLRVATSEDRSSDPAGNLFDLRMNATRSVAWSRLRLPGELDGIDAEIYSTRSATGALFHESRNSVPASAGAPLPLRSAAWHATHC